MEKHYNFLKIKKMNIIKILRKPQLSVILASLVLFVSCSQYDTIEEQPAQSKHTFNYELYNDIISKNKTRFDVVKKSNLTDIENDKLILKAINDEFNTDLVVPDDYFRLKNRTAEEIFDISLAKGWATNDEITIIKKFADDVESSDFKNAISNMENNILTLNPSKKEFAKYNLLVNSLKVIKHDSAAKVDAGGPILVTLAPGCWLQAAAVVLAGTSFALNCISPAVVLVFPCALSTASLLVATTNFHNCMEGL